MMKPVCVQVFIHRLPDLPAFLNMLVHDNYALTSRMITSRRSAMNGLPVNFEYDSNVQSIYWVEFATEEEAAIFKLKYL